MCDSVHGRLRNSARMHVSTFIWCIPYTCMCPLMLHVEYNICDMQLWPTYYHVSLETQHYRCIFSSPGQKTSLVRFHVATESVFRHGITSAPVIYSYYQEGKDAGKDSANADKRGGCTYSSGRQNKRIARVDLSPEAACCSYRPLAGGGFREVQSPCSGFGTWQKENRGGAGGLGRRSDYDL